MLGDRARRLRREQGRERRQRQVHLLLGDQRAVVGRGKRDIALVVKEDQLDGAAQQAAVAVDVAGPQLVADLAGLPVGREPLRLLGPGERF